MLLEMPLEMPFKFIFLPSTVFKQRVIFKDQKVLKIKYLGIEFLLLSFKEQHNKKTLFFQALTSQRWKNPLRVFADAEIGLACAKCHP